MSKPARSSKRRNALVQTYLIAYNIASAAGWAYVLSLLIKSITSHDGSYQDAYSDSGDVIKWVQTVAILEIIHAVVGVVHTPVWTTVMQVASRILLVWGIMEAVGGTQVRAHWAYATMAAAWAVTEVTRYLYYGLNLVGMTPSWLVWCRYSFFYVLYPVGAGSEACEIYNALPAARAYGDVLYYVLVGILCMYPPGFYTMYTHMIGQRKKYLVGSSGKKRA
ncbi:very-long-chain (3R)-3-hydroxyacyl-CoA dehydratase [Synchytrium endobioticum]|uniref:Very-long-chain (3R)-3-hydroxyacyl-CoA dehydratase n=1 Tax=Synchytrium endobioticum TaxID=286115 RepID=A0A507BVQ5_9FUNG|nr:very-long-chain (3R)-3-hydroxyacyl-CoA dehydratase [Synchytrium endobioticum]TPX43365.1 very-long-chain (3R)-3-hydroxyacyl-CoA dehydratase [Synchytrium endobioticum]